jgi:hypothetical protein
LRSLRHWFCFVPEGGGILVEYGLQPDGAALLEVTGENMYVNGRCFLPFKLDCVAWPG